MVPHHDAEAVAVAGPDVHERARNDARAAQELRVGHALDVIGVLEREDAEVRCRIRPALDRVREDHRVEIHAVTP